MNRTLIVNVMKKYAFHHPVSMVDQWRINRAKRRGLAHILRVNKRDSVRVSIAVQFHYLMHGIFRNITIAGSMRLMHAAGVSLVVLAGVAVLYTSGVYRSFTGGEVYTLQARIIKANGDVKVTTPSGTSTFSGGEVLKNGDSIETGEDSLADIATGEKIITRVASDTRASIAGVNNETGAAYSLEHGTLLSTGKHGVAGSYWIITGNAVITPAGTTFSVKYSEGKTVVAVTEGKVIVKKMANGVSGNAEEIVLGAGARAVVTDRIVTNKIKGIESDALRDFSDLYSGSILPVIKSENRREKMGRILEQGRGSLPEIKDAFDRVDVITLFSGQVIRGVIITTGRTYKVLTPGGMTDVPESEVRSIVVEK